MKDLKKIEEIRYPYLSELVKVFERNNGHRIVLARKKGSKLVNVSSWVKTGSINETETNNGVSHFLEHLMFKGTTRHKAGYFDKTLESKGAIVNAATWKDYTFYYVTLPNDENGKNLDITIELHADMMLDPTLPEEELGDIFDFNRAQEPKQKRERSVVIEEIGMRKDQPWTRVYNMANSNMYKSHPYKRDVIGEPQTIATIKREEILNYYKKYYCPKNITTIVVGDFDEEKILRKVIDEFNFRGRDNSESIVGYKQELYSDSKRVVEEYFNVTTGYLAIGFLCPKPNNLKVSICLDMLNIILGEGQSSRLYQNLIEKSKEHIFNMVYCDHYQFKDGSNFFVQANFVPELKERSLSLVEKEIKRLSVDIEENEYKKAKKKIKSKFAMDTETVSDIADTIGYYMTVLDNLSLIEKYTQILEEITIEDLKNTARDILNPNFCTVSILLPKWMRENE